MRKFLIYCVFLSVFVWSSQASAAEKCSMPDVQRIYLGRTFVLETTKSVNRVLVGDGRIAVARAISPTEILLKGSNPGWTNLVLWFSDGSPPMVYQLKVEISPMVIREAEDLIRKLVPESNVQLIQANEELLVEGTVTSQEDMHRVLQTVSAYFRKREKRRSEKSEEGKASTTINIATTEGGISTGEGTEERRLKENLSTDIAIRNNLILLKGYQQVQLEVKIAEVSRSGLKKMGLAFLNNKDWAIGIFPTGTASGAMRGSKAVSHGVSSETTGGWSSSSKETSLESGAELASPFGAAFQVLLHSFNDDSLAILSILKGQGLARLLATPTLVTMSGQEASFKVGGEFPIPVTDPDGNTTVEYKEYGVILRFTPYVIRKDTITLKVAPEVSEPDWSLGTASGGVAVPGVNTRNAETTLQLKDGQTFVMAGLLKETSHLITNKIPLLGDIPVVGTLFTSKDFSKNESELVIIVTPRLVRPLNNNEVPALPGEEINDNLQDIDFFLLNILKGQSLDRNIKQRNHSPVYTGKLGFSR